MHKKNETHVWEHTLHGAQELVVRPEVVAPLGATVNLVCKYQLIVTGNRYRYLSAIHDVSTDPEAYF